jgi:hypothetical protein
MRPSLLVCTCAAPTGRLISTGRALLPTLGLKVFLPCMTSWLTISHAPQILQASRPGRSPSMASIPYSPTFNRTLEVGLD